MNLFGQYVGHHVDNMNLFKQSFSNPVDKDNLLFIVLVTLLIQELKPINNMSLLRQGIGYVIVNINLFRQWVGHLKDKIVLFSQCVILPVYKMSFLRQ